MKNLSSLAAAERERCAELLSLAEKRDYNLSPFLHLISMECHPFRLSEYLLSVHFNLTYYLAHYPDECNTEDMYRHLYSLQRLYIALRLIQPESRELFEKSNL